MKKLLSIAFILVYCSVVNATTYYFDATNGEDTRSGTSDLTAWKSIAQMNRLFNGTTAQGAILSTGDAILLKRGGVWKETINVTKSEITIGAYGSGPKPLLTSLLTIPGGSANWTSLNSTYPGVWEMSLGNTSLGADIPFIMINNVIQRIGRWPNFNTANSGYLTVDNKTYNSDDNTGTLTDNALPSSPSWKGAELIMRTSRFTWHSANITSHSGTTLSFSNADAGPLNNFGYFIQNHIRTLDQTGEWYYNASTHKIAIYSGTSAPPNIQVPTLNYMIYGSGETDIVINNIDIKGTKSNGIYFTGSSHRGYVSNCKVEFAGSNGISASGYDFKCEYDTVNYSLIHGITLLSSHSASTTTGGIVRYSNLTNIGMFVGMGGGNSGLAAINNGSDYTISAYNKVINCGHNGIKYGSQYSQVYKNYIYGSSSVLDDNGAIYQKSQDKTVIMTGTKIYQNIIEHGGYGSIEGTNSTISSAFGIYSDDNMNGSEIYSNVVSDIVGGAFYIHNGTNISLHDNIAFNNGHSLRISSDGLGRHISGLSIKNNQFVANNSSTSSVKQYIYNFNEMSSNPISEWGVMDSNYLTRPAYEPAGVTTTNSTGYIIKHQRGYGNDFSKYYSLDTWKTATGFDAASNKSPRPISDLSEIRFETNTTNQNKTVQLDEYNYISVDGRKYAQSITLKPFTAVVLIRDVTTKLDPIDDAFVRSGSYAGTNYGSDISLVVKGTNTTGFTRLSYLKFSLNSVSNVGSARLRIYGSNTENTSSINISCYSVNDDSWSEDVINFNNAPSASATPLSTAQVNNQEKYYELDVTEFIKSQLAGDKTASFLLKNPEIQDKNVTFNSKENSQNPPQLIIVNPITSGPLDDAFVRNGSYSDNNYGSDPTLEVKGTTSLGYGRLSYLKFSIKNAGNVSSAKLRIYGANTDDAMPVSLDVYGVNNDAWDEGTITRNNAPVSLTTPVTSQSITNVQKYYEFDVTDFVKTQLDLDQIISFKLQNTANDNKLLVFNSMQASQNKPELVIDFTGSDIATASGRSQNNNAANTPSISRVSPVKIQVYPNPVRKTFKVSFPVNADGNYNMQLIDLAGRIYELGKYQIKPGGNNIDINVPGNVIRSGVYFLKAYSNKGKTLTTQLVLE